MPRFSLVLPSTDRPSLLPAAVQSVLSSRLEDFELLISDNFSQLPVQEILKSIADPRIRVLRTDRRLPVSDHWEFFWPHLRGDFVMILGDDNALHPQALEIADRAISAHGLELIVWRAATYFHPDWDVNYPPLPSRGNILGFDPGTTDRWYRCYPWAVVDQFARDLRLSACFPCMLTCIFSRQRAEVLRRKAGRLFWPPNPDVAISVFLMGTLPDKPRDLRGPAPSFAFYDGFLAVGGRSIDSNLASLLTRGRRSNRVFQYFEEFGKGDLFPYHTPKYVTMSNALAAVVTLARALFQRQFASYNYDQQTLALRSIDDMYVSGIVPWLDDQAFLAEVEEFFQSLPTEAKVEVLAYRDRCRNDFIDREKMRSVATATDSNASGPPRQSWEVGGTRYVDMASFAGGDIADAASRLADVLAQYNRRGASLVDYYRGIGVLGEELAGT